MTTSKTCKNGVLNSCDWMVWIFENLLCDIVDEGNNMTACERMFVANVQAQRFTIQFLQKYFLIFDSEDREQLLTSYTKDACFTMTPLNLRNPMDDRNLCGINYTDDRQKLVDVGQSLRFSTKCHERLIILTHLPQPSVWLRKEWRWLRSQECLKRLTRNNSISVTLIGPSR